MSKEFCLAPEQHDASIDERPDSELCGVKFRSVDTYVKSADFWCTLDPNHEGLHAWPHGRLVEIENV